MPGSKYNSATGLLWAMDAPVVLSSAQQVAYNCKSLSTSTTTPAYKDDLSSMNDESYFCGPPSTSYQPPSNYYQSHVVTLSRQASSQSSSESTLHRPIPRQGLPLQSQASQRRPDHQEFRRYLLTCNLREFQSRRSTFQYWPSSNVRISSEEFARVGFYFTGVGDMVECYSCHVILGIWELNSNPIQRHSNASPGCRHVIELRQQSTPVHADEFNHQEILPVDYVNAYSSINKDPQRRLNSFVVFHSRRRLRATHQDFADAGFYALGFGDRVVCFCCGKKLENFEETDDPWEEHARWSPRCEFLRNQKGEAFIQEVTARFSRTRPPLSVALFHNLDRSNLSNVESGPEEIPRVEENPMNELERKRMMFEDAMGKDHVLRAVEIFGLEVVRQVIQRMIEIEDCYYQTTEALCDALVRVTGHHPIPEAIPDPVSPTPNPTPAFSRHSPESSRLAEVERERMCKVCLSQNSNVVFQPCHHMASCSDCSTRLTRCPICRATINDRIFVYLS